MDNMMEKISKVLADEETMKQLGELAQMIGGANPPPPAEETAMPSPITNHLPSNNNNNNNNINSNIIGNGNIDIAKIATLMSGFNKPSPNTNFLMALKPLLKEENQIKADRAIKILKIIEMLPILKESGILGGDLFG